MKFSGKWLPENTSYKEACKRLSKNLDNFKRDPYYRQIVGNDTRGVHIIEDFDKVVKLDYVKQNDVIGNPFLHNGKSAGTLRFMKVVQELPECKTIIEIGGGYGGQCLVTKYFRDVDYTIIDIPESLELAKAYLKANNVECNFISTENIPKLECDLLISDYCLSELNYEGIDFYLDNIFFYQGYFTVNGQMEYIKKALLNRNYFVSTDKEVPKSSNHNNYIIKACHSTY